MVFCLSNKTERAELSVFVVGIKSIKALQIIRKNRLQLTLTPKKVSESKRLSQTGYYSVNDIFSCPCDYASSLG